MANYQQPITATSSLTLCPVGDRKKAATVAVGPTGGLELSAAPGAPLSLGGGRVGLSGEGAVTISSAPGQDVLIAAGPGGNVILSGASISDASTKKESAAVGAGDAATAPVPLAGCGGASGVAHIQLQAMGDGVSGSNAIAAFLLGKSGAGKPAFANCLLSVPGDQGERFEVMWGDNGVISIAFDSPTTYPAPTSVRVVWYSPML